VISNPETRRAGTPYTGGVGTVPQVVQELVRRFRAELDARFGSRLREVRLFGSAARGQMHEDSDVDVFVVLEGFKDPDRDAIFDVVGRLWNETDLRISPTIMDRALVDEWRRQERPLMQEIARDGVPF